MKNIFSKTAEKRTWNGSKSVQLRSIYGISILIFAFLTLGFGQIWADYQGNKAGFWKDGGVVLTWSKNGGSATTTLNYNGESGNSLGDITTGLSLTSSVVHFWREYAYGNICESTIYWELYKSSTKIANGNYSPASWGSWDGNNNTMTYSTAQDFLAKTTGPGNYTIRIYAKLTGQSSDSKYDNPSYLGCGTSWWYNRNTANGYYSITFTIPSKNLTVAGAADGNTVSGSVSGVTKGTAYTITATPTAGYAFSGWTKTSGGSSITIADASSATTTVTFNDYSNNATVTANFVAEETHDITVSYKCGTGIIKTASIESAVGVTTARNITAPAISGFTFSGWTVGSGVKNNSASTSTNPININSKGSGDYTLTANYTCDWELRGSMDGWGSGYSTTATNATTVYADVTLRANTDYSFKFKNESTWYGVTGDVTNITYTNKGTAREMTNTSGGSPDQTMTSAGAGTYRFTWDITNKRVTITYPTSYKVELEVGTVQGNKNALKIYHTSTTAGNEVTSGNYVAAGTKVYFWAATSASEATICKAGYNWWGFYNNASGTGSDLPEKYTDATVSMFNVDPITSDMHVYAVFGEKNYTVKMYNNGNGDVYEGGSIVTSTTAHVATASNTLTATPQTGYYFTGWDQFSDSLTINSPSTASTTIKIKSNKLGNNARLRANYSPQWSVIGTGAFGGWSAYSSHLFTGYTVVSTKDVGYHSITLAANTSYEIKVYDRQNSTAYGGSAVQTIDYAHSGAGNQYTVATTASPKNVVIQSAAGGTYTLNWNLTDKKIAVVYPTSWFITSGQKTEGQDDNAGGSFTAVDNSSNDVKGGKFVANNASVTFTATPNTGYTFDGWYTNEACTTDKNTSNPMTVSSITANKTIYAKFVPKTYTVALTNTGTGYGSGGAASVTATFNQILPAPASLPTAANGYAFMGYYSAANGKGSQFTDASGTWTTSVTDTISDSKWVLDAGATLYAYYKKAEVTELALSASVVGTTIEDSITVTPTISPTPVAPTIICWEVQYSDETPLDPQPEGRVVSGNTYRFKAPTASGSYKIKCILSTGSSCLGETELSNRSANFTVAGAHVVTVIYKCGDEVIAASSKVSANPLESAEVSAPDVFGYSFSSWTAGEGVSLGSSSSTNPNTVTAIYDGTLTANYSKKKIIFLKNTLNWPAPHVYFYKDGGYWDASKGAGCDGDQCLNRRYAHAMINIDGTDIWYYDYSGQGWANQVTRYMAFTDNNFSDHVNFNGARVIYATSYTAGFSEGTPMFIPLADQTQDVVGGSQYYSKGYWINYIGEATGYTLRVYNSDGSSLLKTQKFTSADKLMAMKATVDLEAGTTYKFELLRDNNMVHGNTGTILPSAENEAWEFTYTTGKCGVKTAAAGDYTFTLTYSNHDLKIAIDYPSSKGDYRLVYKDLAGADYWSSGSAHTAAWSHPSRVITRSAGAEDIVSFFIVKGASPTVTFQRISAVSSSSGSEGAVTWVDSTVVDLNSRIDKTGYYNLVLKQSDPAGTISIERIEPYTGEFYIRTAKANNGWDDYVANDHLMHYSSYAEKHSDDHYSHYFVKYIENGANIKFVIANDYSPCISDTVIAITGEPISTNEYGFMSTSEEGVNIRFMWNKATNTLGRAYLTGPVSNQYFVLRALTSDGKTFRTWTDATHHTALGTLSVTESGNSYTVDTLCFIDNQNWVYQADLYAKPSATYKLVAKVNGHETFFRGKEGDYSTADNLDELLGGSGSDAYHIRLIYDFKHDRMMKAWMPSGNIGLEVAINADVLIVRNHQEAAQQVTFSESGKLTEVKTVYGCMQFNRWILNNRSTTGSHPVLDVADQKTIYERSLYFISFPFDVNVNEIFGFGTYWDEWYIEYYDGLNRAKNGYWKDSPPNWKYVTPEMASTFKLKANEGYILGLDLDFMESDNTDFWSNGIETVALYFPSDGKVTNIQATTAQMPALSDEYYCSINRNTPEGDRRVKDSYWRCIGVPSYANYNIALQDGSSQTITWKTGSTLPYLYAWNMTDNTLTPQATSTFNFKAMHSYLVQYAGVINWTAVSAPKLAPARYNEALADREFRLELQQGENIIDQTFVRLSMDEMVTSGFEFDHDMVKELNNGKSNIYTMISAERAAANMLPLSTTQTTVVPVGIQIAANGEYTLAMPDGTHGVGVTLVDNETGVRTSLSALDYTVTLQPGDYTGRFVLEISPIQNTPTGLEEPTSNSSLKGRAQKRIIDGILYIVKDGKIFDARGARVQ